MLVHESDYLAHYGVLGMKWGVRKDRTAAEHRLSQAKKAKKKANKEYSKAFNKASGASQYARMLTKSGRAENERRYAESENKRKAASAADKEYKAAKAAVKEERRWTSEDYSSAKQLRQKKVSQMSDAELRQVINRMNLEQQYKNLNEKDMNFGRKFAQDVLYSSAKNVATEYTTKAIKSSMSRGGKAAYNAYRRRKGGGPFFWE